MSTCLHVVGFEWGAMDTKYEIGQARLEINQIDGELIVLNLDSGCYYTINGSGIDFWQLVQDGLSVEQIVAAAVSHYGVDDGAVRSELVSFCEKLVDEEVFALTSADSAAGDAANYSAWRPEFEPAVIARYDDLVDSFALDPPLVIGTH